MHVTRCEFFILFYFILFIYFYKDVRYNSSLNFFLNLMKSSTFDLTDDTNFVYLEGDEC